MDDTKRLSNEEFQTLRNLYVQKGFFTHQEYYLMLGHKLMQHTSSVLCKYINEQELFDSKDEHFNDIPLHRWEAMHREVARLASPLFPNWTISDTICTMKNLAEEFISDILCR